VLCFYLYFAEFGEVVAGLLVLKVVRTLVGSVFGLLLFVSFLCWEVASVYLGFVMYGAVVCCAGGLYNSVVERVLWIAQILNCATVVLVVAL
jgi:hypothetical protein